jgi:hypothetical protein
MNNSLALAIHHVIGLKYLMQSTPNTAGAHALALFVLILLTYGLLVLAELSWQFPPLRLIYLGKYSFQEPRLAPKGQFLRWLALRNKRDLSSRAARARCMRLFSMCNNSLM